ncbi:MAG: response regulator [Myxococcales bacterium]|nr:response regulator [Myxococcales bacterium]MCB9628751.1 response regulator [Sandaracinaceae bacterium]
MEPNDNKPATGVRARTPRLLLVDDEPMLQFTLRLMLEEFFEVVVADSGDQARAIIEAEPRFDVVLSDLQMPGGSGQDLHLWATQARPELAGRFIFMTGGACSESARAFLARGDVTSVEKPFEFDALLNVIAKLTQTTGAQAVTA